MITPTAAQVVDLRARLSAADPLGDEAVPVVLEWLTTLEPAPAPEPRTAFGQPADPERRAGFVLNAVNTIEPSQIAEHGEDALLAWIRQTLRELNAGGANVMRDASLQIVGMPDGTVVVTGEAGV